MIGAEGSAYLDAQEWQVSLADRWQHSQTHFVGTLETSSYVQPNRPTSTPRAAAGNEVVNNINLLDFSATYAFTKQLNLTFSAPWLFATRDSGAPAARGEVSADGLGDLSLVGRWWWDDTKTSFDHNVSLGFGVKLPTGESAATDRFITGAPAIRTVDQSIQPGDGGLGFIFDFAAFKVLDDGRGDTPVACNHPAGKLGTAPCLNPDCPLNPKRKSRTAITAYATGTYLVNPKNTNGALTFRDTAATKPTDPAFYEHVMSVADQYLARAGLTFTNMTDHPDLTMSLGARLEGVPVNDLVGDSDGFRRPGYAWSVEPGIVYSFNEKETLAVAIPFAIKRDREQSVADQRASAASGTYQQGDAAFADYFVQVSDTLRF